jgi:dipeptidase
MQLMRDHFEGTEFDLTKDVGAGPYKLPYRWRPMTWKVDGQEYLHERAISTQQTGFSFVSQSRSWLPDAVGGVLWFGVDDTYTTVYVPISCGVREAPKAFAEGTGTFNEFNWDSAFWTFNFVSNYTYTRWSDMIVDVQKVQREFEGGFLADQAEVDRTALDLYKQNPALAKDYLTQYAAKNTGTTHDPLEEAGRVPHLEVPGRQRAQREGRGHPPQGPRGLAALHRQGPRRGHQDEET